MGKLKQTYLQYRNIDGLHLVCWTADCGESGTYAEEKQEARELGLKFRVIDGQFYREHKTQK